MKKIFAFLIIYVTLFSCSKKEKDINTDEDLVTTDFIKAFSEINLPIQFKEDYFDKKESDSNFIKSSVVSKFIPDSIFKNDLGKIKEVKFFRKGRFTAEETGETYLFLVAQKKEKKLAYVLCFDKEEIFKTGMVLSERSQTPSITYEGTLDRRLTITKIKNSNIGSGKAYYNKSVFVYNDRKQ